MIGYGSAGALIFSLYIVYDTQLMLGGKHKVDQFSRAGLFTNLSKLYRRCGGYLMKRSPVKWHSM